MSMRRLGQTVDPFRRIPNGMKTVMEALQMVSTDPADYPPTGRDLLGAPPFPQCSPGRHAMCSCASWISSPVHRFFSDDVSCCLQVVVVHSLVMLMLLLFLRHQKKLRPPQERRHHLLLRRRHPTPAKSEAARPPAMRGMRMCVVSALCRSLDLRPPPLHPPWFGWF